MNKKIISIILLTVLILPSLFSCSNISKQTAESFDYFDTYSSLTVYCEKNEFEAYEKEFNSVTKKYHELFDIYNSYEDVTNLKDINDSASLAPVKISRELFDALTLAKELYLATNEKCNIAIGAISSLWHDARELSNQEQNNAYLPSENDITDALLHIDINDLILDEKALTVFYSDPKLKLDFGAIAKGYVASLLYERLIDLGCQSFIVNLGGNIVTHGNKSHNEPYLAKIENPFEDKSLGFENTIELNDETLVTSGSYQRFFTVDGKKYSHIIDIKNGYPSDRFTSVSIKTDASSSALADALSTALFCMSYEDGLALINSLDGVSALWIFNDGSYKASSTFGGAK